MEYARLTDGSDLAIRDALQGSARGISVNTSGSTGSPREVLLSSRALTESVRATHAALGGPGQWLLCVPSDHIAGAMVLARSAIAGTVPVRMSQGPFTAATFSAAAAHLETGVRRYASLVPTQLARVLETSQGRDALATLDCVLVGGAPPLHSHLPANIITTYGASETCGGCVYNGVTIGDTTVRVVQGIIQVAGPTLADGYADGDNSRFVDDAGARWFVTSDTGETDAAGRLTVLGRADDVITSGGLKFHPGPIESALHALSWVEQAVVVGVPDPQWGERMVAVVEAKSGLAVPSWPEVRDMLGVSIERAALPKSCVVVEHLPRLVSGKIDRARARQLAEETHDES